MLGGSQLAAVAQLVAGGSRLKGSLLQTLRQAEREGAAARLAPLAAVFKARTLIPRTSSRLGSAKAWGESLGMDRKCTTGMRCLRCQE